MGIGKLQHSLQQLIFGKRFCEIFLAADHAAARFIKYPVFGRQHHNRCICKTRVAFNDCARLVTIKLGHQDVTKNKLRLIIVDLGQSIETVIRQQDLVTALLEKNLCTAADGIAVVHHKNFERSACCIQLSLLRVKKIK